MLPFLKKHGTTILYLILAVAIIASALIWKDTQYENAWLYVMAVGFVIIAFFEVFSKNK